MEYIIAFLLLFWVLSPRSVAAKPQNEVQLIGHLVRQSLTDQQAYEARKALYYSLVVGTGSLVQSTLKSDSGVG
jgi:hypothetical protein